MANFLSLLLSSFTSSARKQSNQTWICIWNYLNNVLGYGRLGCLDWVHCGCFDSIIFFRTFILIWLVVVVSTAPTWSRVECNPNRIVHMFVRGRVCNKTPAHTHTHTPAGQSTHTHTHIWPFSETNYSVKTKETHITRHILIGQKWGGLFLRVTFIWKVNITGK